MTSQASFAIIFRQQLAGYLRLTTGFKGLQQQSAVESPRFGTMNYYCTLQACVHGGKAYSIFVCNLRREDKLFSIAIHTSNNGRDTIPRRIPAILFIYFFNLTYSRWTSSLPSCLWSQRIFPSLPGSRLTIFLSRCKYSTLTTRQPMVEFYLLTFPRFPLRKKEHKTYFGKNRTHDFRTSR